MNNGHGPCQDTCRNLIGSYECSCDGLQDASLAADNHTCVHIGPCSVNNAGCSHTCLSTMGRVFCLCPDGFMLEDDWKTCQGERQPFRKPRPILLRADDQAETDDSRSANGDSARLRDHSSFELNSNSPRTRRKVSRGRTPRRGISVFPDLNLKSARNKIVTVYSSA